MNRFTADYSSSPAETPPRRKDLFFNDNNIASTTPLVPPPSTIFGSSRLGSGKSTNFLGRSTPATANKGIRHTPPSQRAFKRAPIQYPTFTESTQTEDYEEDGYEDETGYGEDEPPPVQSLMKFSTNSARQSRTRSQFRRSLTAQSALPSKGHPDILPKIARDLTSRNEPAPLEEDDQLILDTERFLQQLLDEKDSAIDQGSLRIVMDGSVKDLLKLWKGHTSSDRNDEPEIGPPSDAPAFDKAYYVASLLLAIHHISDSSIPLALLQWLNDYHISYDTLLRRVIGTQAGVAASELFWEAIQSLALRGQLSDVMRLLGEADFRHAATAVDDGEPDGYRGAVLGTIHDVVIRARQVINVCPGHTNGNWDTSSEDWATYRETVEDELARIGQLATGEEGDEDEFEAEHFGISKPQRDLLRKSQRSRNLPWSIYQGIRILYSILIGGAEELIAASQDWLEASCALTIWWDGSAGNRIKSWSMGVSQAAEGEDNFSASPYLGRLRDAFLCVTDKDRAEPLQVNPHSPVEIAVGCSLQGHIPGVLAALQVLSQPIASAIAEISSTARWVGTWAQPGLDLSDLMVLSYGAGGGDVSKDDVLTVYAAALFGHSGFMLNDGQEVEGGELSLSIVSRLDDEEARRISAQELLEQLDLTDPSRTQKYIDLSYGLGFVDEGRALSEKLGDHLAHNSHDYGDALRCYARSGNRIKIQQLIEMLISYCLVQSRAYPSEADIDTELVHLIENPKEAFGELMLTDPEGAPILQFYTVGYACVRRIYTLRDEALNSSRAYRPATSSIQTRKRNAARALIAAINSAADSIYGGLYDTERQTAVSVDALFPLLGEATAFLAPDARSPRTFTNEQIYALLAAIEDLETVNPRVREATEACLIASMSEFRGTNMPPSPREMLKKSMSSGTSASNFSFSLMGSEMLGSGTSGGGGRSVGSGVLVSAGTQRSAKAEKVDRAWDWRAEFAGEPAEGVASVLLRRLRVGLARELSLAELEHW
jgi:hypothetical protein